VYISGVLAGRSEHNGYDSPVSQNDNTTKNAYKKRIRCLAGVRKWII
jgi:hypothetical protein